MISEGLNCFSPISENQLTPRINRTTNNGSISSFEHVKRINQIENSISNHSIIKPKDLIKNESQYDEIILPNWTYSTGLGVIYNPIIEKRIKTIRKITLQKSKDIDSNLISVMII